MFIGHTFRHYLARLHPQQDERRHAHVNSEQDKDGIQRSPGGNGSHLKPSRVASLPAPLVPSAWRRRLGCGAATERQDSTSVWHQRFADATAMKRQDYLTWRRLLESATVDVLERMAKKSTDLSALNEIGVFHNLGKDRGEEAEYIRTKSIHNFVGRGSFPGVWCALFSECNTYSFSPGPNVVRLTFHPGYKVFDVRHSSHQKMFAKWAKIPANLEKANAWDDVKNAAGESLSDRVSHPVFLGDFVAPYHQAFMQEHGFAAAVGRSDYNALVILDVDAIASMTWEPTKANLIIPSRATNADDHLRHGA